MRSTSCTGIPIASACRVQCTAGMRATPISRTRSRKLAKTIQCGLPVDLSLRAGREWARCGCHQSTRPQKAQLLAQWQCRSQRQGLAGGCYWGAGKLVAWLGRLDERHSSGTVQAPTQPGNDNFHVIEAAPGTLCEAEIELSSGPLTVVRENSPNTCNTPLISIPPLRWCKMDHPLRRPEEILAYRPLERF